MRVRRKRRNTRKRSLHEIKKNKKEAKNKKRNEEQAGKQRPNRKAFPGKGPHLEFVLDGKTKTHSAQEK